MNLKLFENLSETQKKHKSNLMDVLHKYVPQTALETICELIMFYKINLHIEVERKSKYGDYHSTNDNGNRITVNHNLNQFEFLITFIHELAHHTAFLKYSNSIDPHGKEWKNEFKKNMLPFIQAENVFPNDIKFALIGHMRNPKYSHGADYKLLKVLMQYDKNKNYITLDDLKEGSLFKMSNRSKIVLKKLNTLRTYTFCISVTNGKMYQVHSLAKIHKVENLH